MVKEHIKYKQTGIEWMPDVPKHWEVRRIKSFCDYINRGNTPNYVEKSDFKVVNQATFSKGFWDESKLRYSDFGEKNLKGAISKNDILLASTGGGVLGRVWFNDDELYNYVADSHVTILRDSLKRFYPKYFFYFLSVNYNLINGILSEGSTNQTELQKEWLLGLKIALPPIKEQSDISNYLDFQSEKINQFIQKKQRFIKLLIEQRQSIITNAITKGVDKNNETKYSGVEWLGNVPKHWKIVRLKFVGESFIGLTYSPLDLVDKEDGVLVLRSSNIQNGKFAIEDNVYVNKEIPEKLFLKKGDILLCSRNGSAELIGKNILIDEETEGNSFDAFMTVFRSDLNYYLYYFFNSSIFKSQTSLFATSTINQLTNGILNNLKIAYSENIDEQKRIIQHIKTETAIIDTAISKAEREIELIKEYKDAMISEAVMGKRKN